MFSIPPEVSRVTESLEKGGFEAYIIGGCVRDLIVGKKPKDWDITTNATPEQIMAIFKDSFYENNYGTVGVVNRECEDKTLEVIEITPYRLEAAYSDSRRPDSVTFSKNVSDDLKRRDFTINAIAYSSSKNDIIDLHGGQKDIEKGIIRTVGNPDERFSEDALRMLRAIRLHAELGFTLNKETEDAIQKNANLLGKISKERIRDEFIRIILSNNPQEAIILSHKLGVFSFIFPELQKGIGVEQNQAHAYDVWTHNLKTLSHSVKKGWDLSIRLASLLHDIAKPHTREWSEEKKDWTFHGHDVVGAKVAQKALKELHFSKEITDKVVNLVRWHMFFSDTEQITLSAVRRLISNVGKENVWDLMNLRVCDRIGTGRPKENPYRLRKYKAMVEEAMADPISVGMLEIDGTVLIKELGLAPGPKIGNILHALLEEVFEDPKLNTKEILLKKAAQLINIPEEELKKLGEKGKEEKDKKEKEKVTKIRQKYWVE